MADEHTTAQDGTTEEQVVFDAKQQEKVNELIQKAMGKAGREAKEELAKVKTQMQTLQTELTTAKDALGKAKTPQQKEDAQDEVATLLARLNETQSVVEGLKSEAKRWQSEAQTQATAVEAAKKEALNFRRTAAMQSAISKLPFVNTDVVAKLTADTIAADPEAPGKFIVLRDDGTPRLNASLEPMSLDEFYIDFANKNKYLVRGDIVPGTGATESQRVLSRTGRVDIKDIFGPKSNSRLATELKKNDPAEYRRLKEDARKAGLIG